MSRLDELIQQYCPDGVEYRSIGNCTEKVKNIKWSTCGSNYAYIDLTSVDRDTHKITETQTINANNAPSRAQQIVLKGDVLFATTRPTLKRYCLIEDKYDGQICSTGFCVLRANKDIVFPEWIFHVISSSEFCYYVEANQKGASYPAISDKEVKQFKIPVPPLPVQSEIVRILDNFTELTARKKQYGYYRDSLLSFAGNTDVKNVPLGDIAKFVYGYTDKAKETGSARFVRITDISEDGRLNPYDAKYVELTEESKNYLLEKGDLLLARTGATYGKTLYFEADEPAVYASFLIKIILDNSVIKNRYYWHFSKSSLYWEQAERYVSKGGQQQFNTNAVSRVKVPIPSLEVQDRIIYVLDNFDAICSDLNIGLPAEIEARKKQYEFYRDALLTYAATGKTILADRQTDRQTDEYNALIRLCQYVFGYVTVTLNAISENHDSKRKPVTSGNREAGEYPYYGASGIVDYVSSYIFDGDYLLISEDGNNLVARSTPIAFSISGKNWVNNHAHVLKFDCYATRRYVEFYLNSIDLSPYISGGAQPKLNQKNLNSIPISLPSISEQERIVGILDRFDALCNDLTSGLPAEIEARTKQYEYYRDKLFAFEDVKR